MLAFTTFDGKQWGKPCMEVCWPIEENGPSQQKWVVLRDESDLPPDEMPSAWPAAMDSLDRDGRNVAGRARAQSGARRIDFAKRCRGMVGDLQLLR